MAFLVVRFRFLNRRHARIKLSGVGVLTKNTTATEQHTTHHLESGSEIALNCVRGCCSYIFDPSPIQLKTLEKKFCSSANWSIEYCFLSFYHFICRICPFFCQIQGMFFPSDSEIKGGKVELNPRNFRRKIPGFIKIC